MHAGQTNLLDHNIDLIDAMISAADDSYSDDAISEIERSACPTCGSCSGMFTANSMNCLMEMLGVTLPGNGTIVATSDQRKELIREARSEEHTSELQSRGHLVCRLLLEKKKKYINNSHHKKSATE